jgi:hypothetical protein
MVSRHRLIPQVKPPRSGLKTSRHGNAPAIPPVEMSKIFNNFLRWQMKVIYCPL